MAVVSKARKVIRIKYGEELLPHMKKSLQQSFSQQADDFVGGFGFSGDGPSDEDDNLSEAAQLACGRGDRGGSEEPGGVEASSTAVCADRGHSASSCGQLPLGRRCARHAQCSCGHPPFSAASWACSPACLGAINLS